MLVDSALQADEAVREITAFRRCCNGGFRRSRETHRQSLQSPADVLAGLRANGFKARTLAGGYDGVALPPGVTVYLARSP